MPRFSFAYGTPATRKDTEPHRAAESTAEPPPILPPMRVRVKGHRAAQSRRKHRRAAADTSPYAGKGERTQSRTEPQKAPQNTAAFSVIGYCFHTLLSFYPKLDGLPLTF